MTSTSLRGAWRLCSILRTLCSSRSPFSPPITRADAGGKTDGDAQAELPGQATDDQTCEAKQATVR